MRAQRGNGYGVYVKGKSTTRVSSGTRCPHWSTLGRKHVDNHGESPMAHGLPSGLLVHLLRKIPTTRLFNSSGITQTDDQPWSRVRVKIVGGILDLAGITFYMRMGWSCHVPAHGVRPQLMHIKLKQLCCARVLLALCGSVSASNNIGYMLHMCDV